MTKKNPAEMYKTHRTFLMLKFCLTTTATFKSLNVSNIDISTNITEIPSTNLKYTSKKHLTVDTRTGANNAKLKSLHIQNDRIENFLALGRDQNDIKIKESDLTLTLIIAIVCVRFLRKFTLFLLSKAVL